MRDNSPTADNHIDAERHSDMCAICHEPVFNQEFCKDCYSIVSRNGLNLSRCRLHVKTCRACHHPIVDDEGNPGYMSEACAHGATLLAAYIKSDSELLNRM